MQALSQSSFLQALGYAIANSLWQVALLWLITIVINACFKLSSHSRYRVAITAQFAGFAWFIVTLQFYYQQCIKATADAQLLLLNNTVVYQPGMVSNKYNLLSYITKAEMLLPYLSVAYLCLLCLLAVRWVKSFRYTHQLKHTGLQKADLDIRLFVQNMAAQLGIRQKVKIYLSNIVTCPLTIGFLKPMILVPVATINHLTTQQLEAVLLHELAHIRRADYLVNLLLNIIETILFFNPFTRLISQNINKEREHCCDDWVLQFKYNAPMYAEALLRIACLQQSPAIAMKAEGKNEGELLWRVKRLLNHQQKRFNYSQQMITLVVTTCLLVSVAWLQPAQANKQPQQVAATKPKKAVVVAPMTAQINNPFFNPLALLAKPLKEEVRKATAEIAKTDLHEAIDTGIEEAGNALTEVAPTVMHELNRISIDTAIEHATREAQQELKKVKWNEIKNLSPFVDSAFISNAVKMALDKKNLRLSFEKARQNLAASKQQIEKLKQQHLEELVNQEALNATINNAMSWMNDNEFTDLWMDKTKVTEQKKREEEKRAKQKQAEVTLRRLMEVPSAPPVPAFRFRLAPEEFKDCDKIKNERINPAVPATPPPPAVDEPASWTYTNPVYIENAADNTATNLDDDDDSIYSYTAQSGVVPNAPKAAATAKPLLHIVEVNDNNEHVSIIITIRQ